MNTFELSLDLDKSVGVKQWITLRQGDKRGTTLQAILYDHGVLVSGSYTCRVSIRHPNRNTYYRETATYSNGVATVTIDETSAASVVGVTEGYFELLQGSTVIASTESFGVRILQSATDGATVGPPYDSAIEDALDELDAATGRISQMVVDATAEYLAAHPEITTTVQDNSVTDAKLIQSGGVLDRVGRLWWRLENLLTATPAEAESVTVADAAKTPVAGLTVFGKSTQDGTPTPDAPVPIESVTPNLYHQTVYSAGAEHSTVGITITHNEDGTCTCSGTATASAWLWGGGSSANEGFYVSLPAGTYTACGSHRVAGQKKVDGTVSTLFDPTTGSATFTLTETTLVKIVPVILNGTTLNNERVWAALYAGKSAHKYVPYDRAGLLSIGRNLARADEGGWRHGGYNGSTGEETGSSTRMTLTKAAWFPVLPSTRYTVHIASGYKAMVFRYDANDSFIARSASFITNDGQLVTEATCAWCSVLVGRTDDASMADESPSSFGLQIEVGSVAHAYEPYTDSTIAIPLDGHVLRSLPDGTRDEVTVDQYGHVTLTQRVGSADMGALSWYYSTDGYFYSDSITDKAVGNRNILSTAYVVTSATSVAGMVSGEVKGHVSQARVFAKNSAYTTVSAFTASLAGVTLDYALATPVTHDLGTIDPTALVGPDMTAQAVPTAPFALTYERDLNATLARLEAAIADAATA